MTLLSANPASKAVNPAAGKLMVLEDSTCRYKAEQDKS